MPDSPSPPSGKLKIFLGMCPGVGKTYAMLQSADELRKQGTDVVAGVIETHGRKDTAALLAGLEILPLAKLDYRGTQLAEFDIDALLARCPQLALIDELAHTNAPGSRHPKRWQDVAELLDSGIDVHTTVNIQHLESRSDIVAAITNAPVRETIPDSFLDRADQIELIDLTPRDLHRRLEEGKVYLGERAQAAAGNFFKESNLTALRQLALRYTAERVGVDLQEFQSQHRQRSTWRTSDRLLVAVGPSPFSAALIRRTRAIAGTLDAPWSAIAVTTDEIFSAADQQRVTQNLSLARQLGAEAATIEATTLVAGLLSAAHSRNVTQIIIGKSPRHRYRDLFYRPPALSLLQRSGKIDVIAIEPEPSTSPTTPAPATSHPRHPSASHGSQIACAAGISIFLGLGLLPFSGILSADKLALFMLCGVILGALILRPVGVITLALLTGLIWDFLFTEPRFSLAIESTGDLIMFSALTVAALAMGHLTSRLRRREMAVSRQQMHNARLLEINAILTRSHDTDEAISRCLTAVTSLFSLPCAIQLRDDHTHQLQPPHSGSNLTLSEKEISVATWAFEKKQPAGRSTHTLPEALAYHLPLQGRSFAMGVLSVELGNTPLPLAERDLLAAIAAQLGLALERDHLLRAIHHAEFLERGDQLRRSLLDHVSHELRTPVSIIGTAIDAMETGTPRHAILPEMRSAQVRLRRIVDQLVESARIESGAVKPHPEWCDLLDLLATACQRSADALARHPVETTTPIGTPALVWIDAELILAALCNLLTNAAHHTPPGTPIHLHAAITSHSELQLQVRDQGPGLEQPARVFDRFHRGDSSRPGGLGLGLSIVRGLIRGLGGTSEARNHPQGGAEFILKIPVRTTDTIPDAA